MKVIAGRFAEARLYIIYAMSPMRPGVEVPTFAAPKVFKWRLDANLNQDDLALIVEEGRRQLDRQLTDLEHNRNRAGALLTLCLAELAALSAGANRIFQHGLLSAVWALSVATVVLALGGAVALLSARASFGRVDTAGLAVQKSQVRRVAALSYARAVGEGEVTIATRVTVLRDAVLLAILGAILYAAVWPVATLGSSNGQSPLPTSSPSNGVVSCPTCTSPSPSPPRTPTNPATIGPTPPLASRHP